MIQSILPIGLVAMLGLSGLSSSGHATMGTESLIAQSTDTRIHFPTATHADVTSRPVRVSENWNPATSASFNTVTQLFTCQANDDSVMILGLNANGKAEIREMETDQLFTGQYSIEENGSKLLLSFQNGGSLQASQLVTDGKDILYLFMALPDGNGTHCIARTLHVEEVVSTNVIISCGNDAISGQTRNDFRFFTNGSAEWTYYFQLGADELSGSFIGTYRLNTAEGLLSMVFLDRDPLDLKFFTASTSGADPEILSAPHDGDGSDLVGESCGLFNMQ